MSLASLPLVECADGKVRRPSEVYFPSEIIQSVLGPGTPTVVLDHSHKESITELLRWLGVAQSPRFEDVAQNVIQSSRLPVLPQTKKHMEMIVAHLGERLRETDALPRELEKLKQLAWLPGQNADRWFAPMEVYVAFREYLFSTPRTEKEAPVFTTDEQGRVFR